MANPYSIQVDQPNPSMLLLQNQQDHVNHQASIAESPHMVIVVQPSTPPPNQFMNIDQSLPQSNPPPMVPPSTSPAGSVHHATTAEPAYYILTNPPIPFPYNINGPNLACDLTWAQPPNPPPNHDPADNMVQQQIQQPILSAQPQPMNLMIGAPPPPQPPRECSNHDLQETQQTPSKSAPPPCDSPILRESQPSPPPDSSLQKPIFQAPPSSTADRVLNRKRNLPNTAASLANLLPTGTVLVFHALTPSLTGNGKCQILNKYLVGFVIALCAATCFLSSFTDSFHHGGKLYYGIATCNGLCLFNNNYRVDVEVQDEIMKKSKGLGIQIIDFVHAFGTLIVFLIFAVSSTDVLHCFFPEADRENEYSIVIYLPLVAGALSSFLFSRYPTTRKGLGYTDTPCPWC